MIIIIIGCLPGPPEKLEAGTLYLEPHIARVEQYKIYITMNPQRQDTEMADFLNISRKMFIGGLNWETTDRKSILYQECPTALS